MSYDGVTTIQLYRSTKRELDKFKKTNQSYDDVINTIINEPYQTTSSEITTPHTECLKCKRVPRKSDTPCDIINSQCLKAICFNCGRGFIMQKFISINEPANYEEDLKGNKYCLTCYRKLYVDVHGDNLPCDNDTLEVIREKRKNLKKLHSIFKDNL